MNKLNMAKNEVVHKCIMRLSYDTNQLEYSSNVNWSLHLMAVYVNHIMNMPWGKFYLSVEKQSPVNQRVSYVCSVTTVAYIAFGWRI